MKTVIYIDHEPLTSRRKKIFYLEELHAAGLQMEFWDCSQFFHPGIVLPHTVEEKYVRKFYHLTDIEHVLVNMNIDNTLFVVEVFDTWDNRKFFSLLAHYHCYIIRQEMYATALLAEISFLKKLFHTPVSLLFKAVVSRFKALIYKQYKKRHHICCNLKISSGNASDIDIHINHPDWELFQDVKDKPDLVSYPYGVFIDEFFPFHPDLLFFYKQKPGDQEHYQRILNSFFKKIEDKYGLEIIIAAHPKSNYAAGCFEGRKIIVGQTQQLVKNSQMVFMHSSAALAFVIMFNKPLMLITTNAYEKTHLLYVNMIRISSLISLPIYNVEKNTEVGRVKKIEMEIRKKYIYDYLTSIGIEEKKNVNILYDAFSNL